MPEPTVMPEGATITVPEIAPAGNQPTIEAVEIAPHPAALNAAKELGLPAIHGIQEPVEAGFGNPTEELARLDALAGKVAEPIKAPEKTAKEAPAPAKPAAKAKPAKVAAPVTPAQPPAPARIKIGNEEKTAAEIEQQLADLKAKIDAAEKAKEPPKPVTEPAQGKTAEETEADAKHLRDDRLFFIDSETKKFNAADWGIAPTEQEIDKLIVGGPEAVKTLTSILARTIIAGDARAREMVMEKLNPVLDQLEQQFDARLQPIESTQKAVDEYRTHTQFLTDNPDIAANPKGAETAREVRDTYHASYATIQQKIAQGTATKGEQGWALSYEDMTPEQFNAAVATHVRQKLALPSAAAAPVASVQQPPAAPPAPAKPEVKPFGGTDRPGATSAPRIETDNGRHLREMNAHEGFDLSEIAPR